MWNGSAAKVNLHKIMRRTFISPLLQRAGIPSMVCSSSTFQPVLDPAPLAGKWGEREASSDPALKHGANENAEKMSGALIRMVYLLFSL